MRIHLELKFIIWAMNGEVIERGEQFLKLRLLSLFIVLIACQIGRQVVQEERGTSLYRELSNMPAHSHIWLKDICLDCQTTEEAPNQVNCHHSSSCELQTLEYVTPTPLGSISHTLLFTILQLFNTRCICTLVPSFLSQVEL